MTGIAATRLALEDPTSGPTQEVAAARHLLGTSLVLHLAPGAVAALAYVLLLPVVRGWGLPTVAALALSALTAIAPLQLALLARHRALRLGPRLRRRAMVGWVTTVIALAAAVFALTGPLGVFVHDAAFGWWPSGWEVSLGTDGGHSRVQLLWTAGLVFTGSVVVAPLVEEMYFRGFLLPRMPEQVGRATPAAHTALFACYHLWTPWLAPTRFLAVLPLVLVVRRTRCLRVGIVAHMILNAVDLVVLLAFVSRAPS